jgi:hypothetical protein
MKILASVLMLLVVAVSAHAADVDGKWSGTVAGPAGDLPVILTFKADGSKLTGTQAGPDGTDIQIQDGKIEGNNISFTVTFDFGGMPFTLSYKGVVSKEEIKLTGDAFGMPFDLVVKKEK